MNDLEQKVRERYLDRLDDNWDCDGPRLDFGVVALPFFVDAFDREPIPSRRVILIRAIWGFRDVAILPALAKAIRDRDADVWKESLDGFVCVGGDSALCVLRDALLDVARFSDAQRRIEWIDEAIEQIAQYRMSGA